MKDGAEGGGQGGVFRGSEASGRCGEGRGGGRGARVGRIAFLCLCLGLMACWNGVFLRLDNPTRRGRSDGLHASGQVLRKAKEKERSGREEQKVQEKIC